MNSTDLVQNLDIWFEIFRYFTICEGREAKEEIVAKRRTLLSVALLSPTLTNIALDSLWRSLASLKPVCKVINSRDPGQDTLSCQQEGSGDNWVYFS